MDIKRAYYYLFYKYYKFGEASPSIFPSDFTATIAISVLEILFLASFKFYSTYFFGRSGNLKFMSFQVIIPLATIFVINYLAFINNTAWKKYVREFDNISTAKNTVGTWIIIGISAAIIFNFSLSVYVMNQIRITY